MKNLRTFFDQTAKPDVFPPVSIDVALSPALARARGMTNNLNDITEQIIGAALEVHRELGPGMLESAYDSCLTFELLRLGLFVERQKPMPLTYKGQLVDCGYRIDLLVERAVVIEVKSIAAIERVHRAQVLSYLRLSGCKVGLLMNFNVKSLVRDGVRRIVNGFPE